MIEMKAISPITLSVVSICSIGVCQAEEKPMNILLIISDDHSARHLGCYGNQDIYTPNLDRLAEDAMVFERAYVTCPQSAPSRKSILTGKSTVALQATRFTAPLHKDEITFPELLARNRNFYTGLAGRIHHLDGSGIGPVEKYLDEKNSILPNPDLIFVNHVVKRLGIKERDYPN